MDYNSKHIKILDIYIESETIPSNTLLKIQPVADSSVELIKGEESWPDNYNYQLALLSPIINITASYNGTLLKNFKKKIRFEFNLINNPAFVSLFFNYIILFLLKQFNININNNYYIIKKK